MAGSTRATAVWLGLLAAFSMAQFAWARTAQRDSAGALKDGRAVEAVTLRNAAGVSARILTYGATLQYGANLGKGGCVYRMGDGFVLEPQKFPDTPNRPEFGSARLDPEETYRHTMILRVSTAR